MSRHPAADPEDRIRAPHGETWTLRLRNPARASDPLGNRVIHRTVVTGTYERIS